MEYAVLTCAEIRTGILARVSDRCLSVNDLTERVYLLVIPANNKRENAYPSSVELLHELAIVLLTPELCKIYITTKNCNEIHQHFSFFQRQS